MESLEIKKIRNEVVTMDLISSEFQLTSEYNTLNDNYNKVCEALEKEQKKNRKLKNHHKTSMNFIIQMNASVLKENSRLTIALHKLYQEIYENYIEALENNDELAMSSAESELDLITKILNEV